MVPGIVGRLFRIIPHAVHELEVDMDLHACRQ
jgi:hypothetical protein